ncbi:integrase, catalytic region, zinc finger, CCHC-type containing protein [Tanacetum coccineum]
MLDRTDFASWKQRIRLYCWGKDNGVNILKSIDEGPFQMETIRDTIVEGTEGLTKDIYTLINHYTEAKDIWDNVKMLLEGSELTKEDQESQLTSSNARNQATVQNDRVVVQNVQGRHNRGQGNNASSTGATGYRGAQNRVGNENLGQARQIKCYNCNGIGHIVRNCTQLKRGQDNVVDEDVDEQPVQDLALTTMFMANLSSANLVYDEAGPSYDSDILSEVHDNDHYQDAVCEHHEVHEMHDDDNVVPVVQSNVSSVPNDAYMMILNDMHEQSAQYASVPTLVVDKSLTAELATYKEQVELCERRAKFELTEREQKIDE